MPAASEATIGDQIVTDLNAQFSPASFTAVRVYDPVPFLQNATAALKVLVVPLDEEGARTSRASFSRDLVISVGFMKKLGSGTDAGQPTKLEEIDDLNGVAEAVADWFRAQRHYAVANHSLMEISRQQPQQVYPDGLRDGVFFSTVNLTFRKF